VLAFLGATPVAVAAGEPATCIDRSRTAGVGRIRSADVQTIESDHFIVSYTTTGPDSVIRESYASEVVSNLERAYEVLSTELGMRAPSGTHESNGVWKIDVVVADLDGWGVFGADCWLNSGPCEWSCPGEIGLDRGLSQSQLRRTSAHEVMHAFEYWETSDAPRWADESVARWAEAIVFPGSVSPQEGVVSLYYPRTAIWDQRLQKHYSPLFWRFLDRKLGERMLPEVWARACSLSWYDALDSTLAQYGMSFDGALHDFAVWNYYTGKRADGKHFPEFWYYAVKPDTVFSSTPVLDAELGSRYAEETGSNYVFFAGTASRAHLRITLTGSPEWKSGRFASWIGTTGANTHYESAWLAAEADEVTVPDWNRYDWVALIVTNGLNRGVTTEQLRYRVSATEFGPEVIDAAWPESTRLLRVLSPAQGGVAIRYKSSGAAQPTQLDVFDVRGRLVKQLVRRTLPAGDYNAYWDATSESGDAAASGVYVVKLDYEGGTTRRKIVLLR
jgi:hypothetical protein